jgi:hypothetical protein
MATEANWHIIGLGTSEDWEAGRGSLYYIEDKNGETCVPVFTSVERVQEYIATNFGDPKAHMDMLESLPPSHTTPLTEGRFIFMPFDAARRLLEAAAIVGADYLLRDPRPGSEQEIMRLDDLYEDE